jgi:hypothetical protein
MTGGKVDDFIKSWLPKFQEKVIIKQEKINYYVIYTTTHGIIDFWPGKDRIFFRKKQRWGKPGLEWLIKNVLYE